MNNSPKKLTNKVYPLRPKKGRKRPNKSTTSLIYLSLDANYSSNSTSNNNNKIINNKM
jgi:hypothetical protein